MLLEITEELIGLRLDNVVAAQLNITRSKAKNAIDEGYVNVNGKPETKAGYVIKQGDTIMAQLPPPPPSELTAQDVPIEIVYQDDDLAVVFKPSGIVVHPAPGNYDMTMANGLLKLLNNVSSAGGDMRPGIVHRIDKDTSGLLLVAKNDFAHAALAEQIKEHTVERAYKAIVFGHMKTPSGDIEGDIGRSPKDRKKMAIVPFGGKPAKTHWSVLEELKSATLVECVLSTGRTHQIRVHMASIGHPVLGDPLYASNIKPDTIEGGQLLHAYKIGFTHPRTGEQILFTHEPEERFTNWYKKLKLN